MGAPFSGFIYVVYDRVMHKAYLGKKSYISKAKGQTKESDWRHYKSSSVMLNQLLAERPAEEFQWICIEQYKAKGALSYAETYSACLAQTPTKKYWLNKRVEAVSWSVSEPITERHIQRLNEIIKLLETKNEARPSSLFNLRPDLSRGNLC